MDILRAGGSEGVSKNLALSGEPLMPELKAMFRPLEPKPLPQYHQLTFDGIDYTVAYSDYWNSTADKDGMLERRNSRLTGIGQVVDAVIMPVAPHAAVLPERYVHGGMLLLELRVN
jgi:amidase